MFKVLSEIFTERNQDQQNIIFDGDYEFWIEPRIKGELPFQTASIIIECFKSDDKTTPLDFHSRWYRVMNGKNYEIKESEDAKYYNVTPYDIGACIRVAVKAKQGLVDGLGFVTFGPFVLDPCLKPYLEHHLLSCQGSFQFSLYKHGDRYIDDQSDFANVAEFEDTKLGFRFGNGYQELRDFSIDLFETRGITLQCDSREPRNLLIAFQKGQEEYINASILIGRSDISRLVDSKRQNKTNTMFGYSEMLSMENDGRSAFVKQGGDGKGIIQMRNDEEQSEGVDYDNLFEMVIKFENRFLRDCFVTSLRLMRAKRSLPLRTLYENIDIMLRKHWFPPEVEMRSSQYVLGAFELHGFRAILQRMLRINKNLNLEHDNLNECINILEDDISFSMKDLKKLIDDLSQGKFKGVEKYKKVEKSLIDTSYRLEKLRREQSVNNPNIRNEKHVKDKTSKMKKEAENVAKMEKELQSRKKLNKMLLKEISKLKSKGAGKAGGEPKRTRGVAKGDKTFNIFHEANPFSDDRANKSLLGQGKNKENYLMNLESKLQAEENPFQKEIKKQVKKAEKDQNQREQAELESIGELEAEVKLSQRRIDLYEGGYNQMTELTRRITSGESLQDLADEFDVNLLQRFSAADPASIDPMALKKFILESQDYLEDLLKNKNKQGAQAGAPEEPGLIDELGESNVHSELFQTNQTADFNRFSVKKQVLVTELEDLERRNLDLKNSGQSLDNKIQELKTRLSDLVISNEKSNEKRLKIEQLRDHLDALMEENKNLRQEIEDGESGISIKGQEINPETLQVREDEDDEEVERPVEEVQREVSDGHEEVQGEIEGQGEEEDVEVEGGAAPEDGQDDIEDDLGELNAVPDEEEEREELTKA